jgi:hypothetical protein
MILAAALLVSLVIPAGADDEPAVIVGGVAGRPNDEVDVSVTIANNPGIAGFVFWLHFDNTKLTPVSLTQGAALNAGSITSNLSIPGVDLQSLSAVSASWANPSNFTGSGVIYTVRFKIRDDAAAGSSPVTITYAEGDVANQLLEDVDLAVTNGAVTVQAAPAPDTSVLTVGSVTGKVGSEVDIPVTIANNPGIAGLNVRLRFDNTKLEPVSIAQGAVLHVGSITSNLQSGGDLSTFTFVSAFWANAGNISGNGILFTVRFKIKDGAQGGQTPLTLTYNPGDITNQLLEDVDVQIANGQITIQKNPQPAPDAPVVSDRTAVSITLSAIAGAEYRLGTDGAWQSSPAFTGLSPNTAYTFYVRLAETDELEASPESAASVEIKTLKAPLTITGVTAVNRPYDKTTAVALSGGTLNGIVNADDVSFTLGRGAVADAGVGIDKPVTTDITLTGAKSANYTLTQPTGVAVNITPADYTYSVAASQQIKAGANLSALTAPANGTGVGSDAVEGELKWYTDSGRTTQAQDSSVSSLTVGATPTLYWSFVASQPNYDTTPKTGAITITIVEGDPQPLVFATPTAVTKTYGDAPFQNAATHNPADNTKGAITYASSAPTVATVNISTGAVTVLSAGTATITATAAAVPGSWAQSAASYVLTVNPKPLTGAIITLVGGDTYTYTGSAITPALTVKDGGTTLRQDTDYTVVYTSNTNAGTAMATVTGIGNYTDTKGTGFTINKKEISVTGATLADKTYDGKTAATVTGVTWSGAVEAFVAGVDYAVTAVFDIADAGTNKTATVTVTLMGAANNYTFASNQPAAQYHLANQTIAPKPLVITGVTLSPKIYDGTTAGMVASVMLSGVIDGGTLALGTDYTATATYNSADAGTDKTATVAVTLLNENYSLAGKTFPLTAQTIIKATLPTPANAQVYVKQNVETEFALSALFPLSAGWTYEIDSAAATSILINAVSATTRTVTLKNPNYNDVTATIDVTVTDVVPDDKNISLDSRLSITMVQTGEEGPAYAPAFAVTAHAPISVVLYVASYDSAGRLVEVTRCVAVLEAGGSATLQTSVERGGAAAVFRFFLWDDNAVPLTR